MAASKYDFSIEQGSSFKFSLVYKDAKHKPIDLTGWCARLTWITNKNQNQTFTTQNVDYSVYKFDIVGPKITLMLPADTTNSFHFHTAKYDLEIQSPDELYTGGGNYTIRLLFGTVNIVKRFSQSNSQLNC